MIVRLHGVQRTKRETFSVTLDLFDPARPDWDQGDCVVRLELMDSPQHKVLARGPLGQALQLYHLSPNEPPGAADSRLLWDMGHAVHSYVSRLFEAGVLCPFVNVSEDNAATNRDE